MANLPPRGDGQSVEGLIDQEWVYTSFAAGQVPVEKRLFDGLCSPGDAVTLHTENKIARGGSLWLFVWRSFSWQSSLRNDHFDVGLHTTAEGQQQGQLTVHEEHSAPKCTTCRCSV